MRCAECSYYFWDDNAGMKICHADPNWPAPCEYDEKEESEDESYYYNEN